MSQGEENKLLTFERKIVRKINGPLINPNTGLNEQRKNAKLSRLYNAPNLLDFLRLKRLELADHIWRVEGRLIRQALINKPNKKTTRGKAATTLD